jgi:hypothetical protein
LSFVLNSNAKSVKELNKLLTLEADMSRLAVSVQLKLLVLHLIVDCGGGTEVVPVHLCRHPRHDRVLYEHLAGMTVGEHAISQTEAARVSNRVLTLHIRLRLTTPPP